MSVDLSAQFPPIQNQYSAKTCVAKALVSVREYYNRIHRQDTTALSSRFLHYNARKNRKDFKQDGGATLNEALQSIKTYGIAPEQDCEFIIDEITQPPSAQAYINAQQYKIKGYRVLYTLDDILNCLSSGHPVAFGLAIYDSFHSDITAKTGKFITPPPYQTATHAHCVVAVGFHAQKKVLKVRNSYGEAWGDQGHFYLPYHLAMQTSIASFYRKMLV